MDMGITFDLSVIYEFANYRLIIVVTITLLLTFMLNQFVNNKYKIFLRFMFLFWIATVFGYPYSQYTTALNNIKVFQTGANLKCINPTSFGEATEYLVSNKNWNLKKHYFYQIKSNVMVRTDHCKRF